MSIREKIEALVERYGQSNADDLSADFAVTADAHGMSAFWRTTGYSDARTTGFTRTANMHGSLFRALADDFHGPHSRDAAIALCDRLIPLNEQAKAELLRFRAMIGSPEDVEVAA